MRKALIFANGDPNDGEMVQRTLTSADDACVIAADGGARMAAFFGFEVEVVLGDMDSLSERELQRFEAHNIPLHRYPAEKDETDLEIALKWAAGENYNWIRIIGGRGRRFDQELANVYLLALPELANSDVALLAGKQSICLLQPGVHLITGMPEDTISLIPINGDVHGIYTEKLRYPLHDETLHFGPARGISNVLATEQANIRFDRGLLLMVHTIGRAE